MAPGNDASDRMMQAALALASERGWRNVSLADMAARAELPLLEVYQEFPTKTAVLLRLVGSTDRAALSQGPAAATDTPRDRLFDVVMRRFDALQARREGTVAILRDLPSDPAALLCLSARLARSMAWMLEAAGISSSRCVGSVRVKGLALVYLNALRVWMKDDSPDMARTMAALDKGLRRAERIACSLSMAPRRRAPEGTTPAQPPPAPEGPPPLAV
jgi:AcrR family transcriptional regulator